VAWGLSGARVFCVIGLASALDDWLLAERYEGRAAKLRAPDPAGR
jgi:hypothetical protein